jgi:hypothetical protein
MGKASKIPIPLSIVSKLGQGTFPNMDDSKLSPGIVLLLLWICFSPIVCADTALSQGVPDGASGGGTCSFEENRAFVRRSTSTIEITAKFIARPSPDADDKQIRTRFTYLRVLGLIMAVRLTEISQACWLVPAVNATTDLHFQLAIGPLGLKNECNLNQCARLLSDLIESAIIDEKAFSNAISTMVEVSHERESLDLKDPIRSAGQAVLEAYRHIYPAGTNEHIYADLSAKEFLETRFDQFSAWFKVQQNALRHVKDGRGQLSPPRPPVSSPQTGAVDCASAVDAIVRELNIDHHGWGHRSIIMIRNGYKTNGAAGIENVTLRAFCLPDQNGDDGLSAPLWREMAGRLRCFRREWNQDRWLIFSSKKEPAETNAEMWRYAQGIAQALKMDACVNPASHVLVVTFLPQR